MVTKVAEEYGKRLNRDLKPMSEVLITQGASGALACYISAFLGQGDEVVMFEPLWSVYQDFIEIAGGKSTFVPLRCINDEWVFDPEELRAALKRPEAKIFIFTSPHNPCGKVFSLEEMNTISQILDECPHVVCLHDSCYSDLTYDGHQNHWFASISNNWERTITIVSSGKLLNATAWRIGWAIGP